MTDALARGVHLQWRMPGDREAIPEAVVEVDTARYGDPERWSDDGAPFRPAAPNQQRIPAILCG